jgi:hypothetical protein
VRITVKGRTVYLSGKMVGLLVVVCALGVQIPRIVFAFALSDNLEIKQQEEWQLLMTSAVMGAFVLTLGNAYLSHMLAQRFSRRNALWTMTAFAWGANLVFAVFIIAPSLRVGIDKSALASVLAEPFNTPFPLMRWLYCIVLALAFELLAAGSMAAYALASQEEPSPSLQASPVLPSETPKVEPTQPVLDPPSLTALDVPSLPAPDPAEVDEDTEASTSIALDSVDRVILNLYRSNPAMTKEEVARQVTLTVRPITRQTVGNRLKRLERLGLAHVNGVATVR